MLTCRETSLLISQGCERRLSWRERLSLRLHLLFCDACQRFATHMRWLQVALRRLSAGYPGEESEGGLLPEARVRIAEKLRTLV